jgi:uracil-DNA glycosylase family 4
MATKAADFKPDCDDCPRLADFLAKAKQVYPDYFCAPVPAFGDPTPHLLIVGLAPGLHGANRTGRPFTGDYAGMLLYETLHEFGYATRPASVSADDGLELKGCRITNAVKCVPPENKPEGAEINRCNRFLKTELTRLPNDVRILALGQVAHRAVLKALDVRLSDHPFGHGAVHAIGTRTLYDSYHCSRYNTQTNRLTPAMFKAVFRQIEEDRPCPSSPSSSPAT